jgi:GMP synthase-like glutamine amidotransferase
MNIHYFQHVPYEGLGCIESWAEKPGNKVTATKFYEDHRLPFIDLFDLLIIMGGPMGATDDKKYAWMTGEKKMIEHAIKKNKSVLGICLGAQMIADVLGAKVYPNKDKEIGWFPVHATNHGETRNFLENLTGSLTTFHWHGDTFELPENAIHLAKSEGCEHQAFCYGINVLGLQFHPEATPDSILQFVNAGENELTEGKYIQTREEILRADAQLYHSNNNLLLGHLEQISALKKSQV